MNSRYEILMLTIPEISQDDIKNVETLLGDTIAKAGGLVISFERWGKYQLAYPVKKNEYGVYYLMRFEVPPSAVTDLISAIKTVFAIRLGNVVMRFIITALELDAPLTYQRPRSLEETPLRENVGNHMHKERKFPYDRSYGTNNNQLESDDIAI